MSAARAKNNPATIVDVAELAGVSHSTVSRVLNGRPYVKAATRTKVMEAAEELGYVANLQARGLAGGRLGVVGFVVPDFTTSYRTEMIRGVDMALAELGLDLLLGTTRSREQRDASYVSRLVGGLVDGLIILVPKSVERYGPELTARNFPFVVLGRQGPAEINSVVAADAQGIDEAVAHLVELGHRRIGHLSGDLATEVGKERLRGFRGAVAKFGLDADGELIREGDFQRQRGHEGTLELLDLAEPPTAIVAASDDMAVAALQAAAKQGVRVPEEMSIVGCNNVPEVARTSPALTTTHVPLAEMGRSAVELLVNRIEDPERPAVHIEIPTSLIVRESSGPVRLH